MDTTAIRYACDLVGGQTPLAKSLEVSQGLVWQWCHGRTRVAPRHCIPIEKATAGKVTRYVLRPDVFGGPTQERAA